MRKGCFVGIDTSNYTTSLALCDESGEVIANLKRPLSVKEGERGLRQSDAVFLHTKNLPSLFEEARGCFEDYKPLAVGVSAYPRTQEGSYMPCFLAGISAATALSGGLCVPLYRFSHQNGHLMAALYSGDAMDALFGEEFLAFHVSGGTTEVLLVRPNGNDFRCEIVGGSSDLHAGQVIDRIGVRMGLSFPCGPAMERLALADTRKPIKKPLSVKDGYCNLSGLENMALSLLEEGTTQERVAHFVLDFIGRSLAALTVSAYERFGRRPTVYSGGVMSCSILKTMLAGEDVYFATPAFSADNAAGISLLTRKQYEK